jgi:hypothetical protein
LFRECGDVAVHADAAGILVQRRQVRPFAVDLEEPIL